MGVTKKPAVKAKTARKVKISRSEAAFAQSQGISIEELAKSKLPKRGRPVGSKNKPKAGKELAKLGGSLSSEGWVPPPVDWEKLAKRLQEALSTQIRETDMYKKLFEEMERNSKPVALLSFWQRVKLVFTGSY